jgi:hypothetical protein
MAVKAKWTQTTPAKLGSGLLPQLAAQSATQATPVDPGYDAATGAASYNLQAALQAAQYQRGQLGQTYGLGIRPDGSVFDDVSNPYSRAAEQQKAYDRAKRGSTNSMAARGQLYAGSLQNAQNENANVAGRNRDALIRDFMGAQQAITQSEQGAQGQYLNAAAQAESERIARALANRPAAETVAPTAAASAAFKSVPGKDSKGNTGTWHVYPDGRKVFVKGR